MSTDSRSTHSPSTLPIVSAPGATVPKHACDCHCHVFGPYETYPLAGERTYSPPEATVHDYLSMLDTIGFERGVLVQASAHGLDNGALLNALEQGGNRLRGVAVVAPGTPTTELESLYRRGVRGLRFSRLLNAKGEPRYKNAVDIAHLGPMLPAMRDIGLHAQLWIGIEHLPDLAPMIRAAGIPFVIDHLGRFDPGLGAEYPPFRTMCELVAEDRLWVKVTPYRSSSRYPGYEDMRPYHEALLRANEDQLVWGSDWPHINMAADIPDAGRLVDVLCDWTASPAQLKKILADNPARLYGFN